MIIDERSVIWRRYWQAVEPEQPETYFRADRLQEARWFYGLTQKELAFQIGVTRVCVTFWENGYTTPEAKAIYDMAEALLVSTDWLMGRSDEGGPNEETLKRMQEACREPENQRTAGL